MARITLTSMGTRAKLISFNGMTLIELVIVIAVMGILMATAVPSYRNYALRVHRAEAIRMLLQASMCQERLAASRGNYDTRLCQPVTASKKYRLSYDTPDSQGRTYVAMATPTGAQVADPCGSLLLDQSGERSVSASNMSVAKCWGGR
jgi:type IV pilus assembly protein PilE